MSSTRTQSDMTRAAVAVQRVPEAVGKIYGSLCHSFPIMVRTCGLCQAVAFSAAKSESKEQNRAAAHSLLLQHVGDLLGLGSNANTAAVLQAVQSAGTEDYLFHTRRILSAWIYYKRFAVSILKVENAQQDEEGNGQ